MMLMMMAMVMMMVHSFEGIVTSTRVLQNYIFQISQSYNDFSSWPCLRLAWLLWSRRGRSPRATSTSPPRPGRRGSGRHGIPGEDDGGEDVGDGAGDVDLFLAHKTW